MKKFSTASKKRTAAACCAAALLCATALFAAPVSASAYEQNVVPPADYCEFPSYPFYAVGESELEVVSSRLSFEINNLSVGSQMLYYRAMANSTYRFFNPTSEDISQKVVLPLGKVPDYVQKYQFRSDSHSATENFDVRISYSDYVAGSTFDFKNEYAKLSYEMLDRGISPDGSVTVYTAEVPADSTLLVRYVADKDAAVFTSGEEGSYYNGVYDVDLSDGGRICFTAQPENLQFYVRNADGSVSECGWGESALPPPAAEKMSYSDFLLLYRPDYFSYLVKVDWFNLITAAAEAVGGNGITCKIENLLADIVPHAFRWIEFDMTVPANEWHDSTVYFAVYPTIQMVNGYERYYFGSDFATDTGWVGVSDTDVEIRTEYNIINSTHGKDVGGKYLKEFTCQSGDKLRFTLSFEEYEITDPDYGGGMDIYTGIVVIVAATAITVSVVAIVVGIVLVVVVTNKDKKRAGKE